MKMATVWVLLLAVIWVCLIGSELTLLSHTGARLLGLIGIPLLVRAAIKDTRLVHEWFELRRHRREQAR